MAVKRTYINVKRNARVNRQIKERIIQSHIRHPNATDIQIRNYALRGYPLWNISKNKVKQIRTETRFIQQQINKKDEKRVKTTYNFLYESVGFIEYVIEGGSPQYEEFHRREIVPIFAHNDSTAKRLSTQKFNEIKEELKQEVKEYNTFPYSRIISGEVLLSYAKLIKKNVAIKHYEIVVIYRHGNGGLLQ